MSSIATAVRTVGSRKLSSKLFGVALRQAINGQIPIRINKANPKGALTVLKKGAPTETFTPRTASEIIGKIVPNKTAKAKPTSTKLFIKKLLSLERKASNERPWVRKALRLTIKIIPIANIKTVNTRKYRPNSLLPKA